MADPDSRKEKGPARGGPPRPNRSASGMPQPGQSNIPQTAIRHQYSPRAPRIIATSSMTKGGAVVHSRKKQAGKPLEAIYPKHFLPLRRRNFNEVADLPPIRIVYAWQPNDEDVAEETESQAKALLFQEVAKRREYAVNCFNTFKHESIWENLYSLANDFVNDFGSDDSGNLLVDPKIWEPIENNMRITKNFLYGRFDKETFGVWRFLRHIIGWENTFTSRDEPPFHYIKTIFCNLMVHMGQLVLKERALNPGVKWNVKLSAREWRRDENSRVEISNLHEAFSVHLNFRDVELNTFIWKDPSI
ncbi:hypothetical protein F4782DRAFT_535123 [Xylaria castorea]|nr:hypothetical protein F4782DRAFT_535123 [Xylaria castorea]